MFGIDDALLGAGLQAGGSILSGLMGSNATNSASQAQIDAANMAQAQNAANAAQVKKLYSPYAATGELANKRLSVLLGLDKGGTAGGGRNYAFTPMSRQAFEASYDQPNGRDWNAMESNNIDRAYQGYMSGLPTTEAAPDAGYGDLTRKFSADDLNADPVYQSGLKFGLDQGTGAVNNRAIANGGYDSGATLKALTRFANDYGSTKAGESYNRFAGDQSRTYGMLSGQQGMGLNAANGQAGALTGASNANANLMTDIGNAQSAGIVGGANSMAGAFGGIGTAIQGYQNNQILNKLLGQRGNNAATAFGTNDGGPGGWN